MSTGMLLDGPFGTEAIDSSGEILDVEGADISSLEKDGIINWEHRGDDAPGASPLDIIGKVVFAKKIYSAKDCDDARQRQYWDEIKLPFIYGIARLYDGAGHPGAIAAAAQIRDAVANGEPPIIRWSVEGSTLEKKGNVLKRSVIRRVAATIKPCNKSAVSGIISDPNAPKGFDKNPGEVKRDALDDIIDRLAMREHGDPMYERLGGVYETSYSEFDSMQKMLEAGNYNAAPSTLVGGSALQVESLRRRKIQDLTKQASAAIRDWNKLDPIKPFLKHRLPEASDAFIDRFADLAEDWKLKKDEHSAPEAAVQTHAKKKLKSSPMQAALKQVRKPTTAAEEEVDDTGAGPLTIRGKPVPENPNITSPLFDEKTGVLHTPRGSFPMYIPSRDPDPRAKESFHNIMQDPKVNAFHNYATENWAKMNKLMKHGKLPPEAVMHAVLFSQLSPNTPVPVQEMMYGHLVDHMKQTGVDARDPAFGETKEGWIDRDTKDKFPKQSRSHFQKLQDQLRLKMDSKTTGREKGDIASFMLANNKWKNMEQYHSLHGGLMKLLGEHRDDARGAAADLMHHKRKAELHDAKRQRGIEAGKDDIGPYTEGPAVPGLAPKTARYTLGMLGGGNIHVPDTHFARYLFGLEMGKTNAGKPGDNKTISYIKNLLWNENNSHVLDGIDRYYAKHHDAVKHMMEHPQFKHLFDGNPENAIFPAFWKNWVSIVPHEKARGLNSPRAFNEVTDHRPFWETTAPFVDPALKSEEDPDALPMRTAAQHAQWVQEYGEGPALMLYFTHLVPQLLARYTGGNAGVPGQANTQNWYPDENAAEFESPLDLSPTDGDERAYGTQPHVQPAHLDFQKDEDPTHAQPEPKHPAVSGGHYAIMTGEAPRFPVTTHGENDTLEKEMTHRGMKFEKVLGSYGGGKENSYFIHEPNLHHVMDLGRRYGQESVLYAKGGKGHLIYTHGPNAGHMHELPSVKTFAHPPPDNYTTLFGAGKNGEHLHFSWNADWDRLHPAQPLLDLERPQPKPQPMSADEQLTMKFEYLMTELALNLRKAAGEEPAKEPDHQPEVKFRGKLVKPGLAVRHMDGKKFHVMHQRMTGGIVGLPEDKYKTPPGVVPANVHAEYLPADSFSLVKPHSSRPQPQLINAMTHGDWTFNRRPEQHGLIHGADMSQDPLDAPASMADDSKHINRSEWRKMGGGKVAYVKPRGDVIHGVSEAKREAVYHNLAKDFFGMGEYVPNVAFFKHPESGEEMAALERVDGEHIHTKMGGHGEYPVRVPKAEHADTINRLGTSGELDKLGFMNTILGNNDRHQQNYMMTKDGGLKLIDHGLSLSHSHSEEERGDQRLPHYLHMYDNLHGVEGENEPVHPDAHRWLMSLDPDQLHQQLMSHKLPKAIADESRRRLLAMQHALRANPMMGRSKLHRAFWDKKVADISSAQAPTEKAAP